MSMAGKPVPHRDVRTRRIRFAYPSGSLDRHYVKGDLVMSHIVAVLSAMFPEGEDFFVRSVRDQAGKITDPALKKQVAGFIGQEVTHGREHRALNERLQQMGYPTRRVDWHTRVALRRAERLLNPMTCLAITAALEHYTAALAETLLSDERAQELLGTTEVREMLLWHAVEESEHKSVAFDVYRVAGGTERRRIWTMRAVNVAFLFGVVLHTILSLLADRAAYNPRRLFRSIAALRHSPFLTSAVVRRIRAYTKPGFHPDDDDNTALLERWTAELFGEGGRLVDHLR
ncbi:metal-dependent hydrolase [Actinokineospora sp. UTMC 2448]|uniref:metal-dependent hydrolase n=1 Tax=Actinokineospora sp. UTMC 2448 TaxID=2268449 RepID=UPI002164D9BA|nr:metal-dependent hydrolase [Actinokineospora sp. UTMC 2448]UVS79185.1 putative metal-dependent hydrolase [Actinokineospora sp. UTMC 2448]